MTRDPRELASRRLAAVPLRQHWAAVVSQQGVLDFAAALSPTQQEVMEALRFLIVAADTTDIQRALAEHNIQRQTNTIAKRLCELEAKGLVQRAGRNMTRRGHPTTWRRV